MSNSSLIYKAQSSVNVQVFSPTGNSVAKRLNKAQTKRENAIGMQYFREHHFFYLNFTYSQFAPTSIFSFTTVIVCAPPPPRLGGQRKHYTCAFSYCWRGPCRWRSSLLTTILTETDLSLCLMPLLEIAPSPPDFGKNSPPPLLMMTSNCVLSDVAYVPFL